MSKVPTIPDFQDGDPTSVGATVRALKLAVEFLGGLRQGESRGAPLVFVQGNRPMLNQESSLRIGDVWIDPTDNTLKYWNGELWKQVV